MVYARPATAEDVVHVANNLRPEDAREIAAVGGDLAAAFVDSAGQCFTAFSTRKVLPVALFGAVPDGDFGTVWFVATQELRGDQMSLLRESRRWLDHLSRPFPSGLHNYADARNDLHIRWCQLTGFTMGATVDIHGVPFQYIHRPPGAPHLV